MTGAVDPALRAHARRLAGRVIVRCAREGPARGAGAGRLAPAPFDPDGELDLEASVEAIAAAAAEGRRPEPTDLTARRWRRPTGSVALVVDRSGSMGGARLATAALAAAAVAWRVPDRHAVLTFAADVTVVKGLDERRASAQVVDDLLALRGHGSTDLALAVRAAGSELAPAPGRRTLLVLSDCRHNAPGRAPDPSWADRVLVVAPAEDAAAARAFAASAGGRCAEVRGPSQVPGALAALLA